MRPGVTVADYLTGVFAAQATTALLYERDAHGTGAGGVIDAYLYGSTVRILEWTIAAYDKLGTVRGPLRQPVGALRSARQLPEPRRQIRVCIAASGQINFRAPLPRHGPDGPSGRRALRDRGGPGPQRRGDQRFGGRMGGPSWTRPRSRPACVACDVPVGRVYDAADLAADEHMAVRGDISAPWRTP